MTVPRQRLSQAQREEQIFEATMNIIAEQGYGAASLEKIAVSAGTSKGLISHYFGNRETLMLRTAHRALSALRTIVGEHISAEEPAPQTIRHAILAAANLPRDYPTYLRSLDQIVVNLRDSNGRQLLGLDDYEETYLSQEEIFARGQRTGDFRSSLAPRVMATTYQGAVDAMLAHLQEHPEVDGQSYAEQVADLLLGGMVSQADTCRATGLGPGPEVADWGGDVGAEWYQGARSEGPRCSSAPGSASPPQRMPPGDSESR